jgi:hypothetical protein
VGAIPLYSTPNIANVVNLPASRPSHVCASRASVRDHAEAREVPTVPQITTSPLLVARSVTSGRWDRLTPNPSDRLDPPSPPPCQTVGCAGTWRAMLVGVGRSSQKWHFIWHAMRPRSVCKALLISRSKENCDEVGKVR